MTEHKTDMSITEKLNSTSLTKHKADMNVTEKLNMTKHKIEHNYALMKQAMNIYKSNKPQNFPRKRSTKIYNQQLKSMHYLYLQPKNQKNLKLYNKKINRITK